MADHAGGRKEAVLTTLHVELAVCCSSNICNAESRAELSPEAWSGLEIGTTSADAIRVIFECQHEQSVALTTEY